MTSMFGGSNLTVDQARKFINALDEVTQSRVPGASGGHKYLVIGRNNEVFVKTGMWGWLTRSSIVSIDDLAERTMKLLQNQSKEKDVTTLKRKLFVGLTFITLRQDKPASIFAKFLDREGQIENVKTTINNKLGHQIGEAIESAYQKNIQVKNNLAIFEKRKKRFS